MGNNYIRVLKATHNAVPIYVAFVFDVVCWNLLMEHFTPGELNLDRLFEVCNMQREWSYVVGMLALPHCGSRTNGM